LRGVAGGGAAVPLLCGGFVMILSIPSSIQGVLRGIVSQTTEVVVIAIIATCVPVESNMGKEGKR